MDDIIIVYEKGQMIIHLDKFFPSTQNKVNQFLGVMKDLIKQGKIDDEQVTEHLEHIKKHLSDRIPVLENMMVDTAHEYSNRKQELSDLKRHVQDCRFANGVPMTKQQVKDSREQVKELSKEVSELKNRFEQQNRDVKKLKKNLEAVQGGFKVGSRCF